jgi:hypothetical protein
MIESMHMNFWRFNTIILPGYLFLLYWLSIVVFSFDFSQIFFLLYLPILMVIWAYITQKLIIKRGYIEAGFYSAIVGFLTSLPFGYGISGLGHFGLQNTIMSVLCAGLYYALPAFALGILLELITSTTLNLLSKLKLL